MDKLPRLGKRELICLLLFTCNYVVSVWRGFLFPWVLEMGYVILLWHSLSLTYNYFIVPSQTFYYNAILDWNNLPDNIKSITKKCTHKTLNSHVQLFPGCGRDSSWCQPRDCRDVQELGFTTSGLYHVTPVGTFTGFDVWCDLDTEDGGWLVCI